MSRINLKASPASKVVKGMRPEHDFTVTFTPTTQSYPEKTYKTVAKDLSVTYIERAYTTDQEVRIDVSGNTRRLSIELLPPPGNQAFGTGHELIGSRARKITSEDIGLRVRVKTEYGERIVAYEYPSNPPGLNDFKQNTGIVYKEGTFARECVDTVMAMLHPDGASNDLSCQFLDGGTYDVGNVQVQDNTKFFLSDHDWSGISLAKTGAGYGFPLVLVSPQHAIFATHVDLSPVGHQATFRRPDGSTQTVTVQSAAQAKNPENGLLEEGKPDLTVVLFDQPVTGCSVFKLIPPDFELYMPVDNLPDGSNLSVIGTGVLGVARMSNPGQGSGIAGNVILTWSSPKFLAQVLSPYSVTQTGMLNVTNILPTNQLVAAHWRAPYSGDSGSPYFLMAREGESKKATPILVSVLYGVSLISSPGPHLGRWFNWVQEQMNAMSTTAGAPLYSLKKADLSRYTAFP